MAMKLEKGVNHVLVSNRPSKAIRSQLIIRKIVLKYDILELKMGRRVV